MIRKHLIDALRAGLVEIGVAPLPPAIELGRPARAAHGDWSSNVALVCAKAAGRRPRDLAGDLAAHIGARPPAHVRRVEIAGPGFVNFFLDDGWLHDVLRQVIAGGTGGYARHDFGSGAAVNVEFVSANPTGPLHVGGGRWAAYGDTLCNVLARCGYVPHREYYLNDRGRQMSAFAESLVARRQGTEPPEDGYHGDYVREWAAEMPDGADALEWGYARARRDVAGSLERLGVRFDTWGQRACPGRLRSRRRHAGEVGGQRRRLPGRWGSLVAQRRRRRRQGPGAGALRRRAHVPPARHRLPRRQAGPRLRPHDRRVGRRPSRLRGAPDHRCLRPRPPPRAAGGGARATRLGDAPGRRGQDLQEGREPGAARRPGSTSSAPTPPA